MTCEYGTPKTCDAFQCTQPCDYQHYYGVCDEECERNLKCENCENNGKED